MVDGWTGLTEEHRELSRTAARLLADAARKDPLPPDWDALPLGLNRSLWAALGELGLLGLAVPEALGGGGAGVLEQCLLAEQVGAAVPAVPFAVTAAVTAVLTAVLTRSAGAGAALSGAALSGAALSGAAADVLRDVTAGSAVATTAWQTWPASVVPWRRPGVLSSDGSVVSGTLGAVPFGMDADWLLAFDAGGAPLLVDLAGPGVRRESVDSLDVTEPVASVRLTDAPATVLPLPELPVAEILTVFAAELVGTGQRALDGAVSYAKERRQFGRAIGSFQAIKHMLADRYVQLDAARLLVRTAAADAGAPAGPESELAARTALAAASDAADAATGDALQTHGGIGFTWEHPSHVLLKRARARRALLGSQARQLAAIADHVL
ncbi:acyl-CoA dehydrogenase family protein [Pseudonocardia sp. Cha107L01]|uniref:acyl-CoA dehydrogenase family protein n=1 Tax=Pseudonocardia sp. Cha107L01 TaxID=3457576 RepID=UPI00403E61E5